MPGDGRECNCPFRVAHSSEIDPAVGNHGVVDEPEPLGSVFGPEPFIVFPEHHHVDVVVPGNESLVSDSAQEGAVAQ